MLQNFLLTCKSSVIFFLYVDLSTVYDWLATGITTPVLNLYKITYVTMKNTKKTNIYNNLLLMCDERYDYLTAFVSLRNIC